MSIIKKSGVGIEEHYQQILKKAGGLMSFVADPDRDYKDTECHDIIGQELHLYDWVIIFFKLSTKPPHLGYVVGITEDRKSVTVKYWDRGGFGAYAQTSIDFRRLVKVSYETVKKFPESLN